jgi:hypothetical protein
MSGSPGTTRTATTAKDEKRGEREPLAKDFEEVKVTEIAIVGPGFTIPMVAVDETASLIGLPHDAARSIAKICAWDWAAKGLVPSSPMGAVKAAMISHVRSLQPDNRNSGRTFMEAASRSNGRTEALCESAPASCPSENEVRKNFEAFWAAFPRKIRKEDAQRLFLKIVSGKHEHHATAETIVLGAEADKAKRPNPDYVPNPVKWLDEGRWNDEDLSRWRKIKAEEAAIEEVRYQQEEARLVGLSKKYSIPVDVLRQDPYAIERKLRESEAAD